MLVRRAAGGDEDAFRALVDQHAPTILALATSQLRDPVAAEEVAQDVFVRLFRSLPGFRGESNLRTWLTRVTLNRCADVRRRQIRMKRDVPLDDVAYTLSSDSCESLGASDEKERVRYAVDALPDAQRMIVQLKYGAGLSYEQISHTLRIPVGTVGSRLTAALKALRALVITPQAKS